MLHIYVYDSFHVVLLLLFYIYTCVAAIVDDVEADCCKEFFFGASVGVEEFFLVTVFHDVLRYFEDVEV